MHETPMNVSSAPNGKPFNADEFLLKFALASIGNPRLQDFYTPGDELFVSENHGIFNVTSMWLAVGEEGAITMPIDESLLAYVKENIEISIAHRDSLSPLQRQRPLLAGTLDDPMPLVLVDGHHRILRLYQEGAQTMRVHVLDLETTNKYRLTREEVGREVAKTHAGDIGFGSAALAALRFWSRQTPCA